MLFEFYQHLTTPCPRPIKEIGYLRELIGMAARYRRCRTAWQPHLDHCRDWIIQSMGEAHGRVVVLGSGLLYDVPLNQLSDHFDEVVLVDILHMPALGKAIKRYANVRLESRDITGFVGSLYDGSSVAPPDVAPLALDEVDLVISLNVLSQLAIVPLQFAAKKGLKLVSGTARALVQAHLEALGQSAARVCLITEVAQHLCDADQVLEKEYPLAGLDIPQALKSSSTSWDWNFAPHPERHPRYDLVYRVEAYAG